MKTRIMKKFLGCVSMLSIIIGIIGTTSVFATCNANFLYGSNAISAYGKIEAMKDEGRGWNNHLEVHCVGYQIKNGVEKMEDGGNVIKDNEGSATSRIYVSWGKGTYYSNTYRYMCRYCNLDSGIYTHDFVFNN